MGRFSTNFLAALAAVNLACAAPLLAHDSDSLSASLNTTLANRRDSFFDGTIHFYSRYDCTNPCVTNGLCLLSGQSQKGDLKAADTTYNTVGTWGSMDNTCWDVPEGAHSVALTVSTDNGYVGSGWRCERLKRANDSKDKNAWNGAVSFEVNSGKGSGDDLVCNGPEKLPEGMKSISYQWIKP